MVLREPLELKMQPYIKESNLSEVKHRIYIKIILQTGELFGMHVLDVFRDGNTLAKHISFYPILDQILLPMFRTTYCTHTHTHILTHTHTHSPTHTHPHTHTHTHTHTHQCLSVSVHTGQTQYGVSYNRNMNTQSSDLSKSQNFLRYNHMYMYMHVHVHVEIHVGAATKLSTPCTATR